MKKKITIWNFVIVGPSGWVIMKFHKWYRGIRRQTTLSSSRQQIFDKNYAQIGWKIKIIYTFKICDILELGPL